MNDLTFLKNSWILLSMFLVLWAIIASFFAAYYWLQQGDLIERIGGVPVFVNIGIDYWNHTPIWYNNTKALTGMTLFKVARNTFNITIILL